MERAGADRDGIAARSVDGVVSGFRNWLHLRGYPDTSIDQVIRTLDALSGLVHSRFGAPETIFALEKWADLRELSKRLRNLPAVSESIRSVYLGALVLFGEYIREVPLLPANALNPAVEDQSMSIDLVLKAPKYAPLRQSLVRNGIRTIAELERVDIWRYLNAHFLYQLRDRAGIARDVAREIEAIRRRMRSRSGSPERSLVAELISIVRDRAPASVTVDELLATTGRSRGLRGMLKKCMEEAPEIIEIENERYVHRDSILDLDRAAEDLLYILESQFSRLGGYTNRLLLYDGARATMFMFLNDNGLDNDESIYFLARHLFSKEAYKGRRFVFHGNLHIWREEPEYPKSVLGLLVNLALGNDGWLSDEECESFLEATKLRVPGVRQALQIGYGSVFLMYDTNRYLLGQKLGVEGKWKERVAEALGELFEGVEFVIASDISPQWFETLPPLPGHHAWTRLLLQDVIRVFPEIGYRCIHAAKGQSLDTIHPAIARIDSPLQTFADVVHGYLRRTLELPRRMSADELRQLLIEAGMIQRNKFLSGMKGALDDHRFAWSHDGGVVLITKG